MKRRSLDRLVWGVIGLCSFAVFAMLLINQQRGITVTVLQPSDGTVASALTSIEVEFSTSMQQADAASHLVLEPEISGSISWRENLMTFRPDNPLEPGTLYTVKIQAGATDLKGRRVKADVQSQFSIREPSLLYLSPSSGPSELWHISLSENDPAPIVLTSTGGGISDFAVSQDGTRIAYSAFNDQNGIDLWLMSVSGQDARIIVNCGIDMCSGPAWSPDGLRLAYSREEVPPEENTRPNPPHIWTVAISSGQTAPLFQDSQILGYDPTWSPDGRLLALYDDNVSGIRVLDLESGKQKVLETQQGLMGSWSPDGSRMLFTTLHIREDQTVTELLLVDFNTDEIRSIIDTDSAYTDIGVPAWSPTGEWIALNLRSEDSGLGRELWMMRFDGSGAVPISRDPDFVYSGYFWDPWGQAILFQRYPLVAGDAEPDIMVWRVGDPEPQLVVKDGWLGQWLP
jgi:TolB protein